MSRGLWVEYCGERTPVGSEDRFTIGRIADLSVDDNPYLHRVFLELRREADVWLVANVGTQLSATITDERDLFSAHIAPGGVLPLVFERMRLRFGAGTTTYEIRLELTDPPFTAATDDEDGLDADLGAPTRMPVTLTPDQRLVVLALAEHAFHRTGSGPSPLPTSAEAGSRVGWSERKFTKKLDQVCKKLSKAGVRGLHGGPGDIAANRRARLVEYCLTSRIVTVEDLVELDRVEATGSDEDDGESEWASVRP